MSLKLPAHIGSGIAGHPDAKMPSIDVAMARSVTNVESGVWERLTHSLARSVVADLSRRSVIGDSVDKVTDVAKAFSSWDNCMAASFCK